MLQLKNKNAEILNLCYVKATKHQHSTKERKGFPHGYYNTRYEISSIPDSLR